MGQIRSDKYVDWLQNESLVKRDSIVFLALSLFVSSWIAFGMWIALLIIGIIFAINILVLVARLVIRK